MSFSQLKKGRSDSFSKLNDSLKKLSDKEESGDDQRYWKITKDKAGNGSALIRFLPAPDGEDIPWVRIFSHNFSGPGGWYIEKSLTTLGQADPCGDLNRELWNTKIEANQKLCRDRKRKLQYVCNILVIKDPANPENNGKIFLYSFGTKIFEKINGVINPPEDQLSEDENKVKPINPFDFWDGANFRLTVRSKKVTLANGNVVDMPNYDDSKFDAPAPLLGGKDKELEELWKKQYSLQELLDPKHFGSYDQLKVKLERVVNGTGRQARTNVTQDDSQAAPSTDTVEDTDTLVDSSDSSGDSSDDLSYLQKLASQS